MAVGVATTTAAMGVNTSASFVVNNAGQMLIGNVLGNSIVGAAGADTIIGGGGNDTIDGEAGIDRLLGGLGDNYYIITAGDVVVEGLNYGTDTVQSGSGAYALGANLEVLALAGSATTGTGNALGNVIVGNGSGNTLYGLAGSDTLNGGGGTDYLTGGGAGVRFHFSALADSTVAAPDVILDFNHATQFDRIELHLMDANATVSGN